MTNDRSGLSTENVKLTSELTAWFKRAGIAQPDVAVDIADVVTAGRHASNVIRSLLQLDPMKPVDAAKALRYLGELHAWLLSEIKSHLTTLEREWPTIEARLDHLSSAIAKKK